MKMDSSTNAATETSSTELSQCIVQSKKKSKIHYKNTSWNCQRCFRPFYFDDGIMTYCGHPLCKECIADNFFKSEKFEMKCETCGIPIKQSDIEDVLREIGIIDSEKEPQVPDKKQKIKVLLKNKVYSNRIDFCCGICSANCAVGNGIVLQTCSHHICDECLREVIKRNCEIEIKCPYSKTYIDCKGTLTDVEIKHLTTKEEYQRYKSIATEKANQPFELFEQMKMDDLMYIPNNDEFDCPICFVPCKAKEGITIRDCLHNLCLECFRNTVIHSNEVLVQCPFTDDNLHHCENSFRDREIQAVASAEIFNKYLERKLKFAEHSIENTFHCKTIDCPGFGITEVGDHEMICMVCHQSNCLKCNTIHNDQSCEEYQHSLTGRRTTEEYIDTLKTTGDIMNCPKCGALINKAAGCSNVTCLFCKTEICWPTKGPRWGPSGRGDNSGGCKCKVAGKRCHPDCENCH